MNYIELREQICDICNKMWIQGWVAANDGNVTAKLPDGTFLTTPSGISKSFITPEKLLHISADMEILWSSGNYKPSSEIKMHMACYRERSDVGAVVHAHPPTATGFAVAGIHLDRYSLVETVITMGSVPIVPYGTPSTEEIPIAITPYLPNHDVLLLANHGALSVGTDLITAYYRMESLELYAKTCFVARIIGEEKELEKKDIDRLISMREGYKVTGRHPGYKHYR